MRTHRWPYGPCSLSIVTKPWPLSNGSTAIFSLFFLRYVRPFFCWEVRLEGGGFALRRTLATSWRTVSASLSFPFLSRLRHVFSNSSMISILGTSLGVRANLGPRERIETTSGGRGPSFCNSSTGFSIRETGWGRWFSLGLSLLNFSVSLFFCLRKSRSRDELIMREMWLKCSWERVL